MKGRKGEKRRRKIFDFLNSRENKTATTGEVGKVLGLESYNFWRDLALKIEREGMIKINKGVRPNEITLISTKYVPIAKTRRMRKVVDEKPEDEEKLLEDLDEDEEEDVTIDVDDIEDGEEESEDEEEEVVRGPSELTEDTFMDLLAFKGGEMNMLDVVNKFDVNDSEVMEVARSLSGKNKVLVHVQGKGRPVKFTTRVGPIARKCAHPDCDNIAVTGGAFCAECNAKEKEKHKGEVEIDWSDEEAGNEEEIPDKFRLNELSTESWQKHETLIRVIYLFAFEEGRNSK